MSSNDDNTTPEANHNKEPLTGGDEKPFDRSNALSDDNASSDDGLSFTSEDTRSDAVVYPSDCADDWETTFNDNDFNDHKDDDDDDDDDKDLDDMVSAALQDGFPKLTVDEIPAQVKLDDEAAAERKKHHHHHRRSGKKNEPPSDVDPQSS